MLKWEHRKRGYYGSSLYRFKLEGMLIEVAWFDHESRWIIILNGIWVNSQKRWTILEEAQAFAEKCFIRLLQQEKKFILRHVKNYLEAAIKLQSFLEEHNDSRRMPNEPRYPSRRKVADKPASRSKNR